MKLSTKQIAELAGSVADQLESLDAADVERVLKVVRALRGQAPVTVESQPIGIDPRILPWLEPARPPIDPGTGWPAPQPMFIYGAGCDPTACAPPVNFQTFTGDDVGAAIPAFEWWPLDGGNS